MNNTAENGSLHRGRGRPAVDYEYIRLGLPRGVPGRIDELTGNQRTMWIRGLVLEALKKQERQAGVSL